MATLTTLRILLALLYGEWYSQLDVVIAFGAAARGGIVNDTIHHPGFNQNIINALGQRVHRRIDIFGRVGGGRTIPVIVNIPFIVNPRA